VQQFQRQMQEISKIPSTITLQAYADSILAAKRAERIALKNKLNKQQQQEQ